MNKMKIGCVPEHFSFPIVFGIEQGIFQEHGLDIECVFFKGGTGAMLQALQNNEISMAITLTEGTLKAIGEGQDLDIWGWYTTSPLLWGVHTKYGVALSTIASKSRLRIAISRYLSGSHMMGLMYTTQVLKKDEICIDWIVVQNLDGALECISRQGADLFLWEKFTTQFAVDQKIFSCEAIFPTPWPAFLCVGLPHLKEVDAPASFSSALKLVISKMGAYDRHIAAISETFNLDEDKVTSWIKTVNWAACDKLKKEEIDHIIKLIPNFANVLDFSFLYQRIHS